MNAIDPPSGETATLAAVGELRGRAAFNRHHPDRHRPPEERGEEHGPIVRRDGDLVGGHRGSQSGRPATAGIRGPEVEGSSADDETNTIVRPSLVAAGADGVEDDVFRSALAWRDPQDCGLVHRRPPRTAADRLPTRHASSADRHALHHVGSRSIAAPSPTQMSMRASRRAVTRRAAIAAQTDPRRSRSDRW